MTQTKRDYYFSPEPNEIEIIKDERLNRYILTTKQESEQFLIVDINSDTISTYGYIEGVLEELEIKISNLLFCKRIEYLKSLEVICHFKL